MDLLLLIALILIALSGIFLAVLQLPGTWLILAAAAAYDWYYGWQQIGWKWLVALLILAIVVELIDFLAGLVAAKRAGASRRAAIGALVGGFLGMILLTIPIPIPGVGTVIGGLLGCFLGALIGELSLRKDWKTGARVGIFATLGKIAGLVVKTSAAMAIAGATVTVAGWSYIQVHHVMP